MSAFNLFKLPEHIMCQLLFEWLLITDISLMDVALCCHGNTRAFLLRIISDFSRLHPLNSCCVSFTVCDWSWLVQRRYFVKQLNVDTDEDSHNFSLLMDYCKPSMNNFINQNNPIIETNNTSYDVLNRVENITFCYNFPWYLDDMSKMMIEMKFRAYNNLSVFCTNLKSISFDGFNIDDHNLSSLLESNSHCLTQLTLIRCFDITGMNVLPLLLTNIKELKIQYCASLNEEGWKLMSIGLKNLTRLTFHPLPLEMLRNTISSFVYLSYLEFEFDEGAFEEEDFSGIIFPENLDYLSVSFGENYLKESQLKALFSNNLHNLKQLSMSGGQFQTVGNANNPLNTFNSAPSLPQTLTSLDLSNFSIKFSMAAILQLFQVIAKFILPSSLTELNMSSLHVVDNNSMIAMLSNNNLSNLKRLDISYNSNIIKDSFSSVFIATNFQSFNSKSDIIHSTVAGLVVTAGVGSSVLVVMD
eukprot:gene12921-17318_t